MKNIHVLPTNKPSRLNLGIQSHSSAYLPITIDKTSLTCPQNIYITSDEEIKEGDWVIAIEGIWKNTITKVIGEPVADVWRKIILTTDKDLIQDGVQTIDDEFLEWFVKNPSCKFVEVEEIEPVYGHQNNTGNVIYRLIIPKEEPKQERMYSEEEVLDLLQKRDNYLMTPTTQSLLDFLMPREWFEQFKKK